MKLIDTAMVLVSLIGRVFSSKSGQSWESRVVLAMLEAIQCNLPEENAILNSTISSLKSHSQIGALEIEAKCSLIQRNALHAIREEDALISLACSYAVKMRGALGYSAARDYIIFICNCFVLSGAIKMSNANQGDTTMEQAMVASTRDLIRVLEQLLETVIYERTSLD